MSSEPGRGDATVRVTTTRNTAVMIRRMVARNFYFMPGNGDADISLIRVNDVVVVSKTDQAIRAKRVNMGTASQMHGGVGFDQVCASRWVSWPGF